jgi:hypothetical protein
MNMTSDVLAPMSLDEDAVQLLAAYLRLQLAKSPKGAERGTALAPGTLSDESTSWVARLSLIDGVAAERLAPLHGTLIARGLLSFQLLDRHGGIVYRLTPEGRSALDAADARDTPTVEETGERATGPVTGDGTPDLKEGRQAGTAA